MQNENNRNLALRMRKLFLVLLLLSYQLMQAQEWLVDYSVGYGTYHLADIKNLQTSMDGHLGLKITDRFPGYITHTVSIGTPSEKSYTGGQFTYLTTGGRLHNADYSGSYKVDMILNGFRAGVFYKYMHQTAYLPLSFYMQLSSGVTFTSLNINESLSIYSESENKNSNLTAMGFYIEPTVGLMYRITNWLQLTAGGGYEANLWGNLMYSGQQTTLRADWSGLRLYGGVVYTLPIRNSNHD
jgi:hypothetical protein